MKKKLFLMLCICGICIARQQIVYLPFDGDWTNYGDVGYGETGTLFDNGLGVFPAFSTDGVSGQCMDLTSEPGNYEDAGGGVYFGVPSDFEQDFGVPGDPNQFVGIDTEIEQALSGLKSYTITAWLNADNQLDEGAPFNMAHLCSRAPGLHFEVFFNQDSAPRFRDNGTWLGVPRYNDGAWAEIGWEFLAITYDCTISGTTTKMYKGEPNSVDSTYQLREIDITTTYSTNNPGPSAELHEPLIIGNLYASELGAYPDYPWDIDVDARPMGIDGKIDEFRIFGSKEDDSGSLSMAEIEQVMNLDLGNPAVCGDILHPFPYGDINQDCVIDLEDFASVALDWGIDVNP